MADLYSKADIDAAISTMIGEALGEGDKGMAAVAGVILNRARRDNTGLQSVVSADGAFSGYTDPGPKVAPAINDPATRARAERILTGVLNGTIDSGVGNADYFHTTSVNPSWNKSYDKVGQIGQHIFYASGEVPPMPSQPVASRTATINWNGNSSKVSPQLADALSRAQANLPFALTVTSAARSKAENTRVGGAPASQHLSANAVDISLKGLTDAQRTQLVAELSRAGALRMGAYSGNTGLHVDMGEGYAPQRGYRTYAMFDKSKDNMDNAPKWFKDGLILGNAPMPATMSPTLLAARGGDGSLKGILEAFAGNPASTVTAFAPQGAKLTTQPIFQNASLERQAPPAPSYTPPAPWAALAAEAKPAPVSGGNNSIMDALSTGFAGAVSALGALGAPKTPVADGQVQVAPYASASLSGVPPYPADRTARPGGYVGNGAPVAPENVDFTGAGAARQYANDVSIDLPVSKLVADVRKAVPGVDFVASGIFDDQKVKDQKLAAYIAQNLPDYMQYDPVKGEMTIRDARSVDVRSAVDTPIADQRIAGILAPYIAQVQASRDMVLPMPRASRPSAPAPGPLAPWLAAAPAIRQQAVTAATKPAPDNKAVEAAMTLARGTPTAAWSAFVDPAPAPRPAPAPTPAPVIRAPSWPPTQTVAAPRPAPAPVAAPKAPSLPPTAAPASKPAVPAITPVVSPWSAMAAAGPMVLPAAPATSPFAAVDPMGSVARAWAANPGAMTAAVTPPPPEPAPAATASQPAAVRPVAPPPVFTWTTSSTLPAAAAPTAPSFKIGNPFDGGLLGMGGFGGGLLGKLWSSIYKPTPAPGRVPGAATPQPGFAGYGPRPTTAPRGQFGQALGVGGLYRDGAIWAADGSGYGGSAGQITAGLKTGERVYDPNTGEWGLKVGQPVTWTGNRVDGSSAGSSSSGGGSTSGATGTFKGTSTGNTYVVGQQYVNGNGTYQAMPDGTFKRV